MNKYHTSARPAPRGGFSLIETVLALGIMALAITAMLGLLPHGIEMSRKAANAAAETRILNTLTSQLASMPFSALTTQNMKELHFDDQGVKVDNTIDSVNSTYFVRVLVPATASGVTLPGSDKTEFKLVRVNIQIAQTPLARYSFDTQPSRNYTTIPVLIAAQSP